MLNAISLFSSAGIGEALIHKNINVLVANELVQKRSDLYKRLYPKTKIVCGDIRKTEIKKEIFRQIGKNNIDVILASPPCQGLSIAGKNRSQVAMEKDERNYLIFDVIEIVKALLPSYVIIENVSELLKMKVQYKNHVASILEVLRSEFSDVYQIEGSILDASDFGIPQRRLRAIIRLYKKNLTWNLPPKNLKKVTVRDAIGYLPSIESGETSNILWHFARRHDEKQVEWMKHTPTGKSAFDNDTYFPQKPDGSIINGYHSSYRRIKWDEPAPTITIRNDAISSQRNVHPGRLLPDGTYSDARVLSPLELMILNSLPTSWNIPFDTPEILVRQCIGESVPPLLIKKILLEIIENEKNN